MNNIDLEFVAANQKKHLDLMAYSLAIAYLNEHAYDDLAMYDGQLITDETRYQLLALLTNEGEKIRAELRQTRENLSI